MYGRAGLSIGSANRPWCLTRAIVRSHPISLWDGLAIDVFFVCEFKGSSCAPGRWDNGVRHPNDVLQARTNVKNNKYKDVYGLVQGVRTCHRRYVRSDLR